MNWQKACYAVWTGCGLLTLALLAVVLFSQTATPAAAQAPDEGPRMNRLIAVADSDVNYNLSCVQEIDELDLQSDGDFRINGRIKCFKVDMHSGSVSYSTW